MRNPFKRLEHLEELNECASISNNEMWRRLDALDVEFCDLNDRFEEIESRPGFIQLFYVIGACAGAAAFILWLVHP